MEQLKKMNIRKIWTLSELEYLKSSYSNTITSEIAKTLNRSEYSVYSAAFILNLKKSAAFFSSENSGRIKNGITPNQVRIQFKKEHTPWNKGKKGVCTGGVQTQFKKGNIPHNHKEKGAMRITKDGYAEIKITEPNKWELYQRYVYEQYYGSIPKGMLVKFKDGNKQNFAVENLFLASRKDNMQSNTIHHYPKELIQIIKTHSKLKKLLKHE